MNTKKKILILGGGFAGIQCAKKLAQSSADLFEIRLIDSKIHFEYHGAMYRMVTGRSPMEVCLPFSDIMADLPIAVERDTVEQINTADKKVKGTSGAEYHYDYLVLALGSEPSFFALPGIEKNVFTMQGVCGAFKLKYHLEHLLDTWESASDEEKQKLRKVVIIGGGATGVELAGEMGWYFKKLAASRHCAECTPHVVLIEAGARVLSILPEAVSKKVETKLRDLHVDVRTGVKVLGAEEECLLLENERLCAKTIVWTAGVQAHHLLRSAGLTCNPRGKAKVNAMLEAEGKENIYVAGDCADTPGSGMAQAAIRHGIFIANDITRKEQGAKRLPLVELPSIYAIPVGPHWSASAYRGFTFYGKTGWAIRRLVDFIVFISFLPMSKALQAFRSLENTEEATEACPR